MQCGNVSSASHATRSIQCAPCIEAIHPVRHAAPQHRQLNPTSLRAKWLWLCWHELPERAALVVR
eukprot:42024-Chlamydomonas_euryale.AAC.1